MIGRKTNAQLLREIAERDPAEHGQRLARGYGVGPDRMIPVPESLIERIGEHVAREYEGDATLDAMVLEVRALLSQPTPSAEPTYHVECLDGCGVYSYRGQPLDWSTREAGRHMRDYEGHRANVVVERTQPATPPSITDMAPGTTFARDGHDGEVWTVLDLMPRTAVSKRTGRPDHQATVAFIDPSTIRDVTPPPTTPEGTPA